MDKKTEKGEFVGALFLHVNDLVLVMLTELEAAGDERHFKKMKLACESKLNHLSLELKKCDLIKPKTKLIDNVAVYDNVQLNPPPVVERFLFFIYSYLFFFNFF